MLAWLEFEEQFMNHNQLDDFLSNMSINMFLSGIWKDKIGNCKFLKNNNLPIDRNSLPTIYITNLDA